ncbi:MAG: hypothetical protein U1E05_24765 [Patescibacteria group bacterium]|nr:hypothetical protein [Patescibacteria group bacterium]
MIRSHNSIMWRRRTRDSARFPRIPTQERGDHRVTSHEPLRPISGPAGAILASGSRQGIATQPYRGTVDRPEGGQPLLEHFTREDLYCLKKPEGWS